MSRWQQSGNHRDIRIPWRHALACRLFGHDIERVGGHVHCLRCDRNARTAVELP